MNRPPLRINIGAIVLDGIEFSAAQQDVFRASLSAEVERRFAASRPAAFSGRGQEILAAGPLDFPDSSGPESLAIELANRIEDVLKA